MKVEKARTNEKMLVNIGKIVGNAYEKVIGIKK